MTRKQKILRASREPHRIFKAFVWHAGKRIDELRVKLALARSRPIPERTREQFFFGLHARAERSYQPTPYSKDLLVFYGEGLYEDPTLGWDDLARGGVRTHAVPGQHANNRDAMREPAVGFVAEQIDEYLRVTLADAPKAGAAGMA